MATHARTRLPASLRYSRRRKYTRSHCLPYPITMTPTPTVQNTTLYQPSQVYPETAPLATCARIGLTSIKLGNTGIQCFQPRQASARNPRFQPAVDLNVVIDSTNTPDPDPGNSNIHVLAGVCLLRGLSVRQTEHARSLFLDT